MLILFIVTWHRQWRKACCYVDKQMLFLGSNHSIKKKKNLKSQVEVEWGCAMRKLDTAWATEQRQVAKVTPMKGSPMVFPIYWRGQDSQGGAAWFDLVATSLVVLGGYLRALIRSPSSLLFSIQSYLPIGGRKRQSELPESRNKWGSIRAVSISLQGNC